MDEQTKQTTPEDKGKTFTQEDVNAAVEARLSRERAKYADYEALKEKAAKYDKAEESAKSELQKAQDLAADYKAKLDAREKELNATKARDKVSAETGVPAALLTGESEEACKAQAEALLQWRGTPKAAPNRSVDHMLSSKTSTKTNSEYEAGLLKMSGELFHE